MAIRAAINTAGVGSSGCPLEFWVEPGAVWSDERVSLFRPPTAAPIGANPVVRFQDRIDHLPRGLDRVLTGEERSIAVHGVAQKPLVGHFLSRLFFEQVELSLLTDELLPCDFNAS